MEYQVIHSALAATTVAAVLDLFVVGDNLKQLLPAACTLVQRANKLSSSSNTKSGQSLDTQTHTHMQEHTNIKYKYNYQCECECANANVNTKTSVN